MKVDQRGWSPPKLCVDERIEMVQVENVSRFDGDLAFELVPYSGPVMAAIEDIGLSPSRGHRGS